MDQFDRDLKSAYLLLASGEKIRAFVRARRANMPVSEEPQGSGKTELAYAVAYWHDSRTHLCETLSRAATSRGVSNLSSALVLDVR